MAEEPNPQIGERALPDPARVVGLRARQHEGRDSRRDERDDDEAQRLEVLFDDPVVDGELGEIRRQERDGRVRHQRDDGQRGSSLVRLCEASQDAEPTARLPPRPVLDAHAPLVREVGAELPDLHPATTC